MAKGTIYLLFACMTMYAGMLHAQQSMDTVEHTAKSRLRFEDDFSKDAPGHFPGKWIADAGCDQACMVIQDLEVNVLLSELADSCSAIRPRLDMHGSRADSLSIAFDVYFEKPDSKVALSFWSVPGKIWDAHFVVENRGDNGVQFHCYSFKGRYVPAITKKILMVGTGKWHHIKMIMYGGAVTFLIDNRVEASFPDANYYPVDFSLHLCSVTRISKFSLNALLGDYDFNGLVTRSGFTTHALQFDVNDTKIKKEGIAFLVRLTDFLLTHSDVKLEIAGHTDSDGDAVANTKLSHDRAEAIRTLLIANGIRSDRVIAKGYGATQPLQPNTSPEGKANNRRVEFKKL